jgi:hypothetical protein
MKPKPVVELKNLIVPRAMMRSPLVCLGVQGSTRSATRRPTARNHFTERRHAPHAYRGEAQSIQS